MSQLICLILLKMRGKIKLIVKAFPVHETKELMVYNLYSENYTYGVGSSTILQYPCVREGCLTTCYFQGKGAIDTVFSKPCKNCDNNSTIRVYLDVGYQAFLNKYQRYIFLTEPLNVQINPKREEFYFGSRDLKNNLLCKLSDYIGGRLYKELSFKQIAIINSDILNYPKLKAKIEGIITPAIKRKQFLLYSYCKYVAQPNEKSENLFMFLFLHDQKEALKVRILTEKTGELCNYEIYKNNVMIGLIGQQNTLVFVISSKEGTQYYISNPSFHLNREEKVLTLVYMKDWRDELSREQGSLVIDQQTCSVFVMGGFDISKSDSLEYISCFINCKWNMIDNKFEFKYQVDNSHKLFRTKTSAPNKMNNLGNIFKNTYNENKMAFKNMTLAICSFSRDDAAENNKKLISKGEIKKSFVGVGGELKDSSLFVSGRFSHCKPGFRYLNYDPKSSDNPIVNENPHGSKEEINLDRNNYIIIELPQLSKKRYPNNFLVFGGKPDSSQASKQYDKKSHNQIYMINSNNFMRSRKLPEQFLYCDIIANKVDQFVSLLKESQTKDKEEYLRSTFQVEQPILVPVTIRGQRKECYIHYIVFEFELKLGVVRFIPGIYDRVASS